MTVPLGVIGNTPDSGSGESWFDPRRGNVRRPPALRWRPSSLPLLVTWPARCARGRSQEGQSKSRALAQASARDLRSTQGAGEPSRAGLKRCEGAVIFTSPMYTLTADHILPCTIT